MDVFCDPKSSDFFGWSKNKLFIPEGNLQAFYFDAKEFENIKKSYVNYLLKQSPKKYCRYFEKQFCRFLSGMEKAGRQDFTKLTGPELAVHCKKITSLVYKNMGWQYLVWFIFFGPEVELEQKLAGYSKAATILNAISTPEKFGKVDTARQELLRMMAKKGTSKNALNSYAQKYAWLPIYEFADKPWNINDIKKQIVPPSIAEKELQKMRSERKKYLLIYKKFVSGLKDKKLKNLVELVHAFAYIKEMRDDYRRPAYYAVRPFWQEAAKRTNLTLEQANFLTPTELMQILNRRKKINTAEVLRRQKNYALTLLDGKLKIYSGIKALEIAKQYDQIKYTGNLSSTVAFPGKVVGKVKIIFHKNDFPKFQKGDILITVMTHPEYLPLMRQAKAIVTDEGGLTCHAAIVAREMGKPCVIGTKIATKVFKDGDIIEVDANKGIISKLK